ncbi:hypothetical protein CDAR_277741 [Caerostris darwini]|uniref:Secreted protein n=1 Tax=Caerostris darwini TaxID=1538125 RepID=A0AAV4V8J9_9ARAC|nr:hypothetical protein CDAR_277741 [Caerostris darwini]
MNCKLLQILMPLTCEVITHKTDDLVERALWTGEGKTNSGTQNRKGPKTCPPIAYRAVRTVTPPSGGWEKQGSGWWPVFRNLTNERSRDWKFFVWFRKKNEIKKN